jgi:acetylornithine/N-succinyldiaminopimelate aminotransferase
MAWTASGICAEKDILLIADEVQTGKFMSYEYFGIWPDIVTVAKGGGGLPIGGVLFGEKTADVLRPGDHGSTYGGNPVVSAGADYVLSQFDDTFLAEIYEKGRYLRERLTDTSDVTAVSGLGLMVGAEIGDKDPKAVVKACVSKGLLLLTAKNRCASCRRWSYRKRTSTQGWRSLRKCCAL